MLFLHLVPDTNEPALDILLDPATAEALHTIRRQLVHERLNTVNLGVAIIHALHKAVGTAPPPEATAHVTEATRE